MRYQKSSIVRLLFRRWIGYASAKELKALDKWAGRSPDNRKVIDDFDDEAWFESEWKLYNSFDQPAALNRLQRKLLEKGLLPSQKDKAPSLKKAIRSVPLAIGTAAVLALLVWGGTWLYHTLTTIQNNQLALVPKHSDEDPAQMAARLFIADRQSYPLIYSDKNELDQVKCVSFYQNGRGSIMLSEDTGCSARNQVYPALADTLFTPKGGVGNITFADGSRANLNAGSSLAFPTKFTGRERLVQLSGEASFEVSPSHSSSNNAFVPFSIQIQTLPAMKGILRDKQPVVVKAIGTKFTVRAYPEDSCIRIGLLSGELLIIRENDSIHLYSNEAFMLKANGDTARTKLATMPEVTAFKDGIFNFQNVPLNEALEEIGRWYAVRIVYKDMIKDRVTFQCPRSLPLGRVLSYIAQPENGIYLDRSPGQITVRH